MLKNDDEKILIQDEIKSNDVVFQIHGPDVCIEQARGWGWSVIPCQCSFSD